MPVNKFAYPDAYLKSLNGIFRAKRTREPATMAMTNAVNESEDAVNQNARLHGQVCDLNLLNLSAHLWWKKKNEIIRRK